MTAGGCEEKISGAAFLSLFILNQSINTAKKNHSFVFPCRILQKSFKKFWFFPNCLIRLKNVCFEMVEINVNSFVYNDHKKYIQVNINQISIITFLFLIFMINLCLDEF